VNHLNQRKGKRKGRIFI